MNKTLSLIGDRCPSAGNDLVSTRAGIKHYLGEGGEGKDAAKHKRWRNIQPVAEKLLDECLVGWPEHAAVLGQEERRLTSTHEAAAADSGLCNEVELSKAMRNLLPRTKKSAAQVWAACNNMLHTKHMATKSESTHEYMWKHALIFASKPSHRGEGESAIFKTYLLVEPHGLIELGHLGEPS